MPRFMVVSLSEGDHSQGMDAWMAWFKQHDGKIIDTGGPFTGSTTIGNGATGAIGYMMVEADDLEAAKAMVSGSPAATEGQDLEILQIMDMP